MKIKFILSVLLAASGFTASAVEPIYNQYDHHKAIRDKVSTWVDWEAQEHALSAVDAFNVAKKKHGVDPMGEVFFSRLSLLAEDKFDFHTLAPIQQALVNEASALFILSQAHDLPHHEVFPADYMRAMFLDQFLTELELIYPSAEDEALYLQRYYESDLLKLAVYSIALNIGIEQRGEAALVTRLAQQTGHRHSTSLRQFLISGFSPGGTFKARLEGVLLNDLKRFATNWKPSYDQFVGAENGPHPYARVGALTQNLLLSRWDGLRDEEKNQWQEWYHHVKDLPNQKYGYSMVGEAVVNATRDHKQQPHHSRWEFPSLAAMTLATLVAPEIVGELALGELAQELIFSRLMFGGASAADAVYTSEAVELAAHEATISVDALDASSVLELGGVDNVAAVGEEVEAGLHHYAGAGAVEGADYVANVEGDWQRVRRFPSSDDYALYQGTGSFGVHKVARAGAAGWVLNQTTSGLTNWVSSGDYRHVLLLGKGEPASLFRHFGENVKSRYGIPQGNIYSDGDVVSHHLKRLFPEVNTGKLSQLTFAHRLDVVAHGNPYGPVCINSNGLETSLSPRGLASKLFDLGLRKVGVLKVQSCNVGGGFYLSKLARELHNIGIEVGFLSAPKGYLVQLPRLPRAVFDPLPNFSANRYEVISTGLHQGFPGTRYH
ncbi:hypothetical protein [Vibrio ostreicida]|uniref:hypothetical protein n=1 Tax=Vibrio ostreicida TaxID=526588 RepID=UPI001FE5D75D|nr:hypothetical protein [Vibrio ostreicida]